MSSKLLQPWPGLHKLHGGKVWILYFSYVTHRSDYHMCICPMYAQNLTTDRWKKIWLAGPDGWFSLTPRSSEPWTDPTSKGKLVEKIHKVKTTRTKTSISGARKDVRNFLSSISHFTDGKTEAQRGRRSLPKSYGDRVCSYDSQTFFS